MALLSGHIRTPRAIRLPMCVRDPSSCRRPPRPFDWCHWSIRLRATNATNMLLSGEKAQPSICPDVLCGGPLCQISNICRSLGARATVSQRAALSNGSTVNLAFSSTGCWPLIMRPANTERRPVLSAYTALRVSLAADFFSSPLFSTASTTLWSCLCSWRSQAARPCWERRKPSARARRRRSVRSIERVDATS